MSDRQPSLLTPVPIDLDSAEFRVVTAWSFSDAFVGRLLQSDIRQRFKLGRCSMWAYRDPDNHLVGFGTLDLCYEYAAETAGRIHPYIPLLVVNQPSEGHGYGKSIVRHLSDEATLLAFAGVCSSVLYLDVYTTSTRAIHLYEKCGFSRISDEPIPDAMEGGLTYIVMARQAKIASGSMSMFIKVADSEPPVEP